MTSIRKFWWAGVTLAALAGCAEESSTTTTTTTPAETGPAPTTPPGGAPAAKPETPPTGKPEMKDEGKPEAKEAEKPETPPKIDAPKIDAPKIDAPKAEPDKKSDTTKLSDEELAEIKKLPASEQPLALKQAVCPVSGEHLGSMDVPVKVNADGKTFFICCKGCKKEVDADPKAVVAKLKD